MNKLDKLNKHINAIRYCSDDIVKGSVSILNQVETDKRVMDFLIKKFPSINKQHIKKVLLDTSFSYFDDARNVRKEIDEFADKISDNEELNETSTPFMCNVWKGDMFDLTGTFAVAELQKNLEECLKNMSVKNLVYKTIDVLEKEAISGGIKGNEGVTLTKV